MKTGQELRDRLAAILAGGAPRYHEKAREQGGDLEGNVHVALQSELPALKVVPQEISRVVVGLITNAIDALNAVDTPEVMVSTARSGNGVEISVRDNGPGIPAEIRERSF